MTRETAPHHFEMKMMQKHHRMSFNLAGITRQSFSAFYNSSVNYFEGMCITSVVSPDSRIFFNSHSAKI